MKPILIASPRTGSSIIGKQISDLAEQWWGYKNYIHEYFSIGNLIKTEWNMDKSVIISRLDGCQ
jgi:hypothetical protein